MAGTAGIAKNLHAEHAGAEEAAFWVNFAAFDRGKKE